VGIFLAGGDQVSQALDIIAADLEQRFKRRRQALSHGYAKLKAS
jgi:hypothetical protein